MNPRDPRPFEGSFGPKALVAPTQGVGLGFLEVLGLGRNRLDLGVCEIEGTPSIDLQIVGSPCSKDRKGRKTPLCG